MFLFYNMFCFPESFQDRSAKQTESTEPAFCQMPFSGSVFRSDVQIYHISPVSANPIMMPKKIVNAIADNVLLINTSRLFSGL